MIPKDTIQTVIETARIDEVAGDFVSLKKRGANLIGLCPFHNEKTPSFTVSPGKGLFKCFGCGVAGNAVKFVMEHEKYSFPEAIRYLANKYNIEIVEEETTDEQKEAENERESLLHVSEYANKFFIQSLFETEEGKAIGLSYFKERGYLEETIKSFQLGYNPNSWDALTKTAHNNGYKLEYLVKSGLTIEKDGKYFDRFRARVIFPIHNLSGRVIGFGGRILKASEKRPKYVNSPETEIYNKRKNLYGLFQAKSAIVEEDNCLLVEGYTDVISLYQNGIKNVVSSSGTSLTEEQIRLIKRYTTSITILYDGDEAGIKASFRGIDMILEQGMNVRIVLFPKGSDPDSYAREHRTAEVKEFVRNNAGDFITFKSNLLLKEIGDDPIKKAGLIKEIITSISVIPDGITRSLYVKECSSIMKMQEEVLVQELNKLMRKKHSKKFYKEKQREEADSEHIVQPKQENLDFDPDSSEFQEKDIIRLLMNYGQQEISFKVFNKDNIEIENKVNLARFIIQDLVQDEIVFTNDLFHQVFEIYKKHINEDNIPDEKIFINHEDEKISNLAIELMSSPHELSKNWEVKHRIQVTSEEDKLNIAVTTSVLSYKLRKVEQMITENREEIKKEENEKNMLILLEKQNHLLHVKQQISKELGRIVTR